MSNTTALGIDVGSATTKLVAVDPSGTIVAHWLEETEPRIEEQTARMIEGGREGNTKIPVVTTGYGRKLVAGSGKSVTEITCHAKGVHAAIGQAGTLIDIGGQDSKVIVLSKSGRVVDFAMNDKCAAGTGRFLENTAARLKLPLEEMSEAALSTTEEVSISSTCTVFAESELVSLIARGTGIPEIVRGLHRSLVKRVVGLAKASKAQPPIFLSGGVAQSRAVRSMLSDALRFEVHVPEHPQLMGAYGAALIALDS